MLKPQLRAFLRVSADHPVLILLPVVSGVEDVRRVREVLREVQRALTADGRTFDPAVPVGAMIEIPAAALMAGPLTDEADFLSLGTNDLVQYVLAPDREDESAAGYYQPLHPGCYASSGSWRTQPRRPAASSPSAERWLAIPRTPSSCSGSVSEH